MIAKLRLPFPMLSDPDRDGAIRPYGVADEHDPRHIARPATVVVTPEGVIAFHRVSRDFADRVPETALIDQLRSLGLPPTTPEPVDTVPPEPGPQAMPLDALPPYLRGARFAATAMKLRIPAAADEADRYIELLEHYREVVRRLRDAV